MLQVQDQSQCNTGSIDELNTWVGYTISKMDAQMVRDEGVSVSKNYLLIAVQIYLLHGCLPL